jgi:hypothetical protein
MEDNYWKHIDKVGNDSRRYADLAIKDISLKDYEGAISKYEEASRVIEEMVDEINNKPINLLLGMVASVNSLKIDRKVYLKKVEKLKKKVKR